MVQTQPVTALTPKKKYRVRAPFTYLYYRGGHVQTHVTQGCCIELAEFDTRGQEHKLEEITDGTPAEHTPLEEDPLHVTPAPSTSEDPAPISEPSSSAKDAAKLKLKVGH